MAYQEHLVGPRKTGTVKTVPSFDQINLEAEIWWMDWEIACYTKEHQIRPIEHDSVYRMITHSPKFVGDNMPNPSAYMDITLLECSRRNREMV
jgi:hypothetical protein